MYKATPLFIEFFGLPGSGKSTIARSLIQRLGEIGVLCPDLEAIQLDREIRSSQQPLSGVARNIFFGLKHPLLTFRLKWFGMRVKPFRFSTFKRSLVLLNTLSLLEKVAGSDNDVVVLEEGILQNLWSFGVMGRVDSWQSLQEVVHSIYTRYPVIVFKLETDVELAAARIREGAHYRMSRIDQFSPEKVHDVLSDGIARVDEILDLLPENTLLYTLPAETSVTDNVERILSYLENYKILNRSSSIDDS